MRDQWIPWPGIGQVNLKKISPIIHNPYFRRLSEIRQLGFAFLVFPGATHNRRDHSVGAYDLTGKFTACMVQQRRLTKDEAWNLTLYALLHDIGHGPFSHVIEAVTKTNHEQYGLRVLEAVGDDVRRCGGDVGLIKSYLDKKDPAYSIVSDKNFGMEKLDYLVRDQESISFGPNIRWCAESVFNHLVWDKNRRKLMVDIKALDATLQLVNAYIYFYRNVHLGKSTYNIQRFMQKLIYQLLNTPQDLGGVTEEELWQMVDGDLIFALKNCKNEVVKNGMRVYARGVKCFPKTGVAIRPRGYGWLERKAGKKINVCEVDKSFFDFFHKKSKPDHLERLETLIAEILGIQGWQVAVSHVVEKHRFIPQDFWFFDGIKKYSLKKQDPEYFELLGREMDKYLCIRICVIPEYRRRLYAKRRPVFKQVCRFIGYEE